MLNAVGWLKRLYKKKLHFMNHDALHCPVKKGHYYGGPYYHMEESLLPAKEKKNIEYCPMCGKKFNKGITRTINQYTHIIE